MNDPELLPPFGCETATAGKTVTRTEQRTNYQPRTKLPAVLNGVSPQLASDNFSLSPVSYFANFLAIFRLARANLGG